MSMGARITDGREAAEATSLDEPQPSPLEVEDRDGPTSSTTHAAARACWHSIGDRGAAQRVLKQRDSRVADKAAT